MITAKGIYLDLNDSTYFYRVNNFKFYFSSRVYRQKFIDRLNDYVKSEKLKFEQKYNVTLQNSYFFLFMLYAKIEKRGFRVENLKEVYNFMPRIDIKFI